MDILIIGILLLLIILISITINFSKGIGSKKNDVNIVYKNSKEMELHYSSIFSNSPLAIIVWDKELNILDWNRASMELFGWRREELAGREKMDILFPIKSRERFFNINNRSQITSTNTINEIITKDGNLIKCEWNNTTVFNEVGDIKYVVSIVHNIEERIKIENVLRDQQKKLQTYSDKLEERNNQLINAIKEIDLSNKQKKELNNKLEKLIKLSGSLYESALKDEEEFLSSLLHTAAALIPEVDYGSVYLYQDDHVRFIDTIGHDLSILNKLPMNKELFLNHNTDDVVLIKNIVNYTLERIDDEIKEQFLIASKPIKETLKVDLHINDELIAGICLDIAKEKEISFDDNSKTVMLSFRNLANAFFTIQRYGKAQKDFQKEIIFSIIKLLEIHDSYTKNHSHNVAVLSQKISEELNMSKEEVNSAFWAGLVHDIGKTLIPYDILNKKDKLSFEEFMKIKHHPHWGYTTLSQTKHLKDLSKYVLHHHEYWNGTGYPNKLKENEIPLISQIITVADSWDAMISDRSYRKSLSKSDALNEIIDKKGVQFSPKVVDAFLRVIEHEELFEDTDAG